MAKQKYKRKPYVHQSWPKMVYHPVHGGYTICQDESEIPEGFVDNLAKCENPPNGTPSKCYDFTVPDKFKAKAEKPAAKKETKKVEKPAAKKVEKPADDETDDGGNDETENEDDEVVTLESLELDRKGAIEMLEEGKVKFKKNASNDTLAGLVADLLEEE